MTTGISLSGLASGLETATMIDNLMKLERKSYEKLEAKQSYLKDLKSFYTSINNKLSTLRNAAADLTLKSNFQLTTAKSSNESVSQVSVSNTAISTGSYLLDVTQLATPHVLTWTSASPDADLGGTVTKNVTFKYNGAEVNVTATGNSVSELMESIKNQINGNVKGLSASVVNNNGNKMLIFNASTPGTDGEMQFVDAANWSTTTGNGVYIKDTDGLFSLLGTKDGVAAKQAEFKLNGVEIKQSSNVISNVIDGVTLTLTGTGLSTITAKTDTDKIASKVEAFVKAYNDISTTIRDVIKEGGPLQGDSTLRDLSNQMNQWFNSLVDMGDGSDPDDFSNKYTLSSFGLEIDKGITKPSLMTGTISFDKEKFAAKFLENPDLVISLFNKTVPDASEENGVRAVGIAALFRDNVYSWNKADGVLAGKIKGYDSEVAIVTDQMLRLDDKLNAKEARMKSQFTAMEVALSKLQSEQKWMTTQLNALTASSKS
ncbi:Flagellar hook-associated protein 2 [compost metagenome]